jgi:hypothetical protein
MAGTMHGRLDDPGNEHSFDDYGFGCHCSESNREDLRELLPPLMDRFAHPAPPPIPFSYKSIDPDWSMWGWDVHVDRPALEFSRLFDAGPDGFGLTGSGAATVHTVGMFEPGQQVEATVVDAGGTTTLPLTADAAGRLTVPVALGPGNPYQQLSPEGNLWALTSGAVLGAWPAVTASVRFAPVGGPRPRSWLSL